MSNMKIFMREKKEKPKLTKNDVKLVVVGKSSDKEKNDLETRLEKKGIKTVVSDSPVLGVFNL